MFYDVVIPEDIVVFTLLCRVMTICGLVATHFLWEKFFAVLILTDEEICLKCPFRRTKRIILAECIQIGVRLENIHHGIPKKIIFFVK